MGEKKSRGVRPPVTERFSDRVRRGERPPEEEDCGGGWGPGRRGWTSSRWSRVDPTWDPPPADGVEGGREETDDVSLDTQSRTGSLLRGPFSHPGVSEVTDP